jgi:hypothetical protein
VVAELKAQVGQRTAALARLAIRITTPDAARPLIVLLPRGARSWYVDVPGRREDYRAEIGLMLPSGEFRAVAASNTMRMPRTGPSPVPATRRVAFDPAQAPGSGPPLEVPAEEPSSEEVLLEAARASAEDDAGAERDASGGSSEMSAAGGPRRARAGAAPRPDAPRGAPAAGGSSSDLMPRRKPG